MLHANETIDLRPGAKIESTRKYMCNIHNNSPDMYTCLDSRNRWRDSISYTDIVKRFNQ